MTQPNNNKPGMNFSADEYVMAYHGPLLYDALILLAENWTETNTLLGTTGPHYFIHYKGWKVTPAGPIPDLSYTPPSPTEPLSPSPSPSHSPLLSPNFDPHSDYYRSPPLPQADDDRWNEWVPEDKLVKLDENAKKLCRKLVEVQTSKGKSAGVGEVAAVLGGAGGAGGAGGGGGGGGRAARGGSVNGAGRGKGGASVNASRTATASGSGSASASGNGTGTGANGAEAGQGTGAEAAAGAATNGGSPNPVRSPGTPPILAASTSTTTRTSGSGRPVRAKAAAAGAAAGEGARGNAAASGSGTGTARRTGTNAAAGPSSAANGDKSNGKGKEAAGNGGPALAGRKRVRDATVDTDSASNRQPEVKIVIPDVLKLQLVDDWENVTKHNQLVTLPRTPNVRQLLNEYRQYVEDTKEDRSSRSTSLLNEIISGITLYFDKALGNNLLYRFERAQYVEQSRQGDGPLIAVPPPPAPAADADGMDVDGAGTSNGNGTGNANGQAQAQAQAQAPVLVRTDPPRDPGRPGGRKKAMSEIYGAEHLLRLFVNFGPFISYTNIDSESLNVLRECINDIMKWMIKEQNRLFVKEYETTTAHYQRLSRA